MVHNLSVPVFAHTAVISENCTSLGQDMRKSKTSSVFLSNTQTEYNWPLTKTLPSEEQSTCLCT